MDAEPEILASIEQLAGVWATGVKVYRAQTVFTLDFTRVDPSVEAPGRAVLVARVALCDATTEELRRKLEQRWEEYARDMLPPEVFDEAED